MMMMMTVIMMLNTFEGVKQLTGSCIVSGTRNSDYQAPPQNGAETVNKSPTYCRRRFCHFSAK
jgi:hypothetical protein